MQQVGVLVVLAGREIWENWGELEWGLLAIVVQIQTEGVHYIEIRM